MSNLGYAVDVIFVGSQAEVRMYEESVTVSCSQSIIIVRPPAYVGRPLCFASVLLFLPATLYSTRRSSGASSKLYQWLGPRWLARKIHSLPVFPNFYTKSKTANFGLHFRPQSRMKRSGFKTKRHIEELK